MDNGKRITFNEKFKVQALLMFVDKGIQMYSSPNLTIFPSVCRCVVHCALSAAAGKAGLPAGTPGNIDATFNINIQSKYIE